MEKKNKKKIEKKENIKEINEEEKYIRLQAEFLNFKNRTQMELQNAFKYEGEEFIKKLLPVVDNFERAIKMDDNDMSDEVTKFLNGFKMIYTSILSILNEYEVVEIECEGIEFNPETMDAILTDHNEEKPENVVLEVLNKGYIYKDKVIRHAMVKVNK